MPEPVQAGLWGLLAAASLVIGALDRRLVRHSSPERRRTGDGLRRPGALISALSFDLTEEAFKRAGGIDHGRRPRRRAPSPSSRQLAVATTGAPAADARRPPTGGPALVLGALLDGIPESIVLGASLLGGFGVSLSFLAAVFISNVPGGHRRRARPEGRGPVAAVGSSACGWRWRSRPGVAAGVGNAAARRHADPGRGDRPGVRRAARS